MNELKAIESSTAVISKVQLVYIKSEADKVIAELKADYQEACDRLQTANLIKDEQLAATRHQKYKRCLAMSRQCRSRACFYDTMREGSLYWAWKSDNAYKWHKRWLKLAKKFKDKEAK
jgi:hypothetical protein